MSKAERIKKEHIKKVNELLDKGHVKDVIKEEVIDFRSSDNVTGFKNPEPEERPIVLRPSSNVTNLSEDFINKMNNLGAANKCV